MTSVVDDRTAVGVFLSKDRWEKACACLKGHSALKKAEVPVCLAPDVCVSGEMGIRQEGSSLIFSLNVYTTALENYR